MDDKYEPTDYMKRIIMFNAEVKSGYQQIRKEMNKRLFGKLTPSEQEQWDKHNATTLKELPQ